MGDCYILFCFMLFQISLDLTFPTMAFIDFIIRKVENFGAPGRLGQLSICL